MFFCVFAVESDTSAGGGGCFVDGGCNGRELLPVQKKIDSYIVYLKYIFCLPGERSVLRLS